MFVKLLTTSTSPSKFVLAHKRGDSLAGTCLRDKREDQHKRNEWHQAAARLNLGKKKNTVEKRCSVCADSSSFLRKTIGSYMFQKSLIGALWFAAVVALIFLSAVTPLPKALWQSGLQSGHEVQHRQQCNNNSITMIPVIINGAARNIGICLAQVDKVSLSMHNIPNKL